MIDINALRKQQIVRQIGDITGGMGEDTYSMPPVSSTGPTFPDSGITNLRTQSVLRDPAKVDTGNEGITDLWRQLQGIYTPETESRDRYNQLLTDFPERNKPGIARKLVAGGMGWGATRRKQDPIQTMETAMYAPYIRDVGEWKEKAEPYYKAAQLENTANVNERTLAGNILTADAAARREETRYKTATEKNENQMRIARLRADAQMNGVTYSDDGQYIIAHDKNGRIWNTGIKSGNMDEADKIALMNAGRIEAARVFGSNQATTAEAREGQYVVAADGQIYRVQGTTKTPVTGGGPNRPVTGIPSGNEGAGAKTSTLETDRIKQNTMEELYQTDVIAQKWITQTVNKTSGAENYALKPRPVTNSKDAAEWDYVKKKLDSTYTRPGATGDVNLPSEQKSVTKKEYSPSRNQTRITYADGTTEIVQGRR